MVVSISKKQPSAPCVPSEEHMRGAGLPGPIIESVLGIAAAQWGDKPDVKHWGGPDASPVLRARRFVDYWLTHGDDKEIVGNAWKAIAESSDDAACLVSLFMMMPDELTDQPFAAFFGRCVGDPDFARDKYAKRLKRVSDAVENITEMIKPPRKLIAGVINPPLSDFQELMSDLCTTANGRAAARILQDEFRLDVLRPLLALEAALKVVDPFAKYTTFTKQWKTSRSPKTIYRWRVAYLGRYLKTPRWAELATIANINCTKCSVKSDTLGKIYRRVADKTP